MKNLETKLDREVSLLKSQISSLSDRKSLMDQSMLKDNQSNVPSQTHHSDQCNCSMTCKQSSSQLELMQNVKQLFLKITLANCQKLKDKCQKLILNWIRQISKTSSLLLWLVCDGTKMTPLCKYCIYIFHTFES